MSPRQDTTRPRVTQFAIGLIFYLALYAFVAADARFGMGVVERFPPYGKKVIYVVVRPAQVLFQMLT